MAAILDIITVGEKKIYQVDAPPASGGGTSAEVGSIAMLEDVGQVGKLYVKVGPSDNAWDQVLTLTSGVGIRQGNFKRVALYDTNAAGYTLDDQVVQNSQTLEIMIVDQASRTVPLVYQVPNPGNGITTADFVLTEGAQTINGDKTFNDNIVIQGDLTVNGNTTFINTTNTDIQDKLVTLNKGGGLASASDSGIEFEENGVITAWLYTSTDRLGYSMKAPAQTGEATFLMPAVDQSYTLPETMGRVVVQAVAASGIANQLAFWNSTERITNPTATGLNALTWDSSNFRLGIGTTVPTESLHVNGNTRLIGSVLVQSGSNDHRILQAAAATTNATAATLQTIAIPNNSMVLVETRVVCRKTGGAGSGNIGDGGSYVRTARFKNISGTVTVHTLQSDYTSEELSMIGMNCQLAVSGTNAIVSVTGLANDNISWEATTLVTVLD